MNPMPVAAHRPMEAGWGGDLDKSGEHLQEQWA